MIYSKIYSHAEPWGRKQNCKSFYITLWHSWFRNNVDVKPVSEKAFLKYWDMKCKFADWRCYTVFTNVLSHKYDRSWHIDQAKHAITHRCIFIPAPSISIHIPYARILFQIWESEISLWHAANMQMFNPLKSWHQGLRMLSELNVWNMWNHYSF